MKNNKKAHIYAFVSMVFWSSGFPFTRMINNQIGSYSLVCMRCVIAALVLLGVGIAFKMRRVKEKKDHLWFFFSGLMGFFCYYTFSNLALETVDSASMGVLFALAPVVTAVLASVIYGEKISGIGWLSMAGAFAGVVLLLMWGGSITISSGDIWGFLCAAGFAVYNIMDRKLEGKGYTSMERVTYSAAWAGVQSLIFLPQALADFQTADMSAIIAMLYLAIIPGGLIYLLWSRAMSYAVHTSTVSNYLFLNPIMSALIAMIILREFPGMGTIIGGAVIIVFVVIFSKKGIRNS